jgi:hypothetical protein
MNITEMVGTAISGEIERQMTEASNSRPFAKYCELGSISRCSGLFY